MDLERTVVLNALKESQSAVEILRKENTELREKLTQAVKKHDKTLESTYSFHQSTVNEARETNKQIVDIANTLAFPLVMKYGSRVKLYQACVAINIAKFEHPVELLVKPYKGLIGKFKLYMDYNNVRFEFEGIPTKGLLVETFDAVIEQANKILAASDNLNQEKLKEIGSKSQSFSRLFDMFGKIGETSTTTGSGQSESIADMLEKISKDLGATFVFSGCGKPDCTTCKGRTANKTTDKTAEKK